MFQRVRVFGHRLRRVLRTVATTDDSLDLLCRNLTRRQQVVLDHRASDVRVKRLRIETPNYPLLDIVEPHDLPPKCTPAGVRFASVLAVEKPKHSVERRYAALSIAPQLGQHRSGLISAPALDLRTATSRADVAVVKPLVASLRRGQHGPRVGGIVSAATPIPTQSRNRAKAWMPELWRSR